MRTCLWSSILFCTLLPSFALAADPAIPSHEPMAQQPAAQPTVARQVVALWLSRQLHHPVEAAQVLDTPESGTLEGCAILRARATPIGATALSLRCPGHLLPQLLLLKIPLDAVAKGLPANLSEPSSHASATSGRNALPANTVARIAPPLVRTGASLQADWRTPVLHAELLVVAMDSGAAGAEIRVRVAHGSRVLRARILTAHSVAIIAAGA